MAVVLGTNSGFVTVAPTADPAGNTLNADNTRSVSRDTSPSTVAKIIEMGWWCDDATEEANFEVGLYAADGTVVPGEAGTRLFVAAVNAKGTTAGWKSVVVDWPISPSTSYWLGMQLDDTATLTTTDAATSGGLGRDTVGSSTSLPNPFGGGTLSSDVGAVSIYALWQTASGPANLKTYNTNVRSNIKSINGNPIANCKSLDTNV